MYLQSLEMIGFKSFAPKTVLEFHQGVTAVVGPNGCGKSNVLDAVRWVLGEQSAKALRGGEMADVIFSGTDSRPALGMAEVSLTFAECEKELGVEWNQVRITRRVFRDGKSEYLLNKTPCRLRDIHELFMDTGIGRSAYSIMEQGKIDSILSSRPEDRRAIFEEAAGITKYKAQKKEALRKLEYTEANLLRVQDIIKEVKRQIGSLQRQAAKARRYQGLLEDLRTLDTHLSHRNFQRLAADLGQCQSELDRGEEARLIHETEIEAQEAELGGFRSRLGEIDAELAALRDHLQTLRGRSSSAQHRIATNTERCEEARSLIERHQGEIAAGEQKTHEQQAALEETDQQLAALLEHLRTGEEQMTRQNERVTAARESRMQVERGFQQLSSEISGLESRLASLRTEISSASGKREAGEARLQILRSEAAAAGLSCEELSGRHQAAVAAATSAVETLASARAELDQARQTQEVAQRTRQETESQYSVAAKRVSELGSRLDVLRQLNAAGEGLGEGTQAVLKGLDNPDFFRPAIQGSLTSQIDVDPPYIAAIEGALGTTIQAVLIKDAGIAESALLTLAEQKVGKTSLIPTDWINDENTLPLAVELPQGAIAWASDKVRSQGPTASLLAKLLRGIVIVDSLETAFALKPANPHLGFVTLTGELISQQGVAYGGRTGEQVNSALARKAQIAELEADFAAREREAVDLDTRRQAAIEAAEFAAEALSHSRQAVQSAEITLGGAEREQAALARQLSDLNLRAQNFAGEIANLESTLRQSIDTLSALEARIGETGEAIASARSRQAELQAQIDAARERERITLEEASELRIRIATERQRQENLSRQRAPITARLTELADLMAQRRRDIVDYERKIQGLTSDSTELEASIVSWESESAEGEAQIQGVLDQRREVTESVEALETALRLSRRQLTELQEQRGRLEVRSTQLQMRSENIREHIARRYQIDLGEFTPDTYALLIVVRDRSKRSRVSADESPAPAEGGEIPISDAVAEAIAEPVEEPVAAGQEEGIPWDRIEEFVAELTEKLEGIGPVNLDAIQEYDELEQRHQFLDQQNTDLVNSKAELMEVISRINRTTRELFAETFEKIRVNFQEMFVELFGGGRANLILSDESDPLESGIEIIAKPPGKQLQSISLLSGGEKTMTAVSLLFSIYMVKPSPFCVLDEMDAPLDESNINRFIKIVDRFVDQSQFLVITHNKRTISRADMVFGVTMEEHGVSKIVSVKFHGREERKDPAKADQTSIAESFGKHGDLHSERQLAEI